MPQRPRSPPPSAVAPHAFLLVAGLVSSACGRVGYEPWSVPGSGVEGPTRDAGRPDAAVPGRPDGGASGSDDAGTGEKDACGGDLPGTLALWAFEHVDDLGWDTVGGHRAEVHGAPSRGDGPPGCGRALVLPGTLPSHLTVPDAPVWDLVVGSVDLRFRAAACGDGVGGPAGLVERDAPGVAAGHFRVRLAADCSVEIGLVTAAGSSLYRSGPLEVEVWHHVAVSFDEDDLRVYVDRALVASTGRAGGLAGNDEPWVIGAARSDAAPGTTAPLGGPFAGAIDHVRITTVAHAFD